MDQQVINGLTFEQAQQMVQGSKYKVLHRFKQFATHYFTYEDLDSEAEIAILRAWQTWRPDESKFNTYATNMINWLLYRALDAHHDVFKMNVKIKNDLKAKGETFATLSTKKLTLSPEFNKEFGLDGEKPFTRDLFNTYVYRTSMRVFGANVVSNRTSFNHNQSDDDFDITDNIDDEAYDAFEGFEMVEKDHDSKFLGKNEQIIYSMLRQGHDIGTVAKELGISKYKMMQKYAGIDLRKEKSIEEPEYDDADNELEEVDY